MVKLEDPVAPFRGIVAKHRRANALRNAELFRLGGHAPVPRPSTGPVAVVGACGEALESDRIEVTAAYIGALGGLLADLGYDVYAVSSLPQLDAPPAFVGWVGGGETPTEREQLAAIDAPGLRVGPDVDDAQRWGSIQPEGQPTDIEFIRTALNEIRRLASENAARSGEAGDDPSTLYFYSAGRYGLTRNGTAELS